MITSLLLEFECEEQEEDWHVGWQWCHDDDIYIFDARQVVGTTLRIMLGTTLYTLLRLGEYLSPSQQSRANISNLTTHLDNWKIINLLKLINSEQDRCGTFQLCFTFNVITYHLFIGFGNYFCFVWLEGTGMMVGAVRCNWLVVTEGWLVWGNSLSLGQICPFSSTGSITHTVLRWSPKYFRNYRKKLD